MSLEIHLDVCSHMPGIIYKFENIQKFFDNMQIMGDLSFSTYFDFGTTSGNEIYNFDEYSTLYPVSYALVVAFHPNLHIEEIFVVRWFHHTFEELNKVGYLLNEMLPYFDRI